MAAAYPDFRFEYRLDHDPEGNPFQRAVWRGMLAPLGEDFANVLVDLDADRNVAVSTNGRLKHLAQCSGPHPVPAWVAGLASHDWRFEILTSYSGGRDHPVARVLRPRLVRDPVGHLNADGSICAYLASENVWDASLNTVADFLDHISIWAAKRIVWEEKQYWPGMAHPPDVDRIETARTRLKTLRRGSQCPCCSGVSYFKCHRAADMSLLAAGDYDAESGPDVRASSRAG